MLTLEGSHDMCPHTHMFLPHSSAPVRAAIKHCLYVNLVVMLAGERSGHEPD
jgi:hypothetical protein